MAEGVQEVKRGERLLPKEGKAEGSGTGNSSHARLRRMCEAEFLEGSHTKRKEEKSGTKGKWNGLRVNKDEGESGKGHRRAGLHDCLFCMPERIDDSRD